MSATGAEVKTGIICGMEILVVDDELAIRKGLRALLEASGYEVRTARDGAGALTAVRAKRPNLVLLDVMMPVLDGFSACAAIRRNDRDLPIVFLTAKDADEDQVKGLEVGADDFVSKGAVDSVLLARIKNAIERGARLAGNAAPENLTKTEADIYRLLASEIGRHFSVIEIFSAIRGVGCVPSDGNLRTHMSRLRSKLPSGLSVDVVRGRGYALVRT